MQFQVPQFIEVEDKIFGPLTFKQFLYLVGGGGLSLIAYLFLPLFLAFFVIIPVMALSAALSFYKVHNKPFINVIEAAFYYTLRNKLYIWKKEERLPEARTIKKEEDIVSSLLAPKLSDSKLKDLAWSLDVNEKIIGQKSDDFRRL